MSNVVAKALCVDDRVIPIPFDFSPSQTAPDKTKNIIVAIIDGLDTVHTSGVKDAVYELTNKVYDYYGMGNCRNFLGNMPSRKNTQLIFCVSAECLIEKIQSFNSFRYNLPSPDISPLWTEERLGISADEAFLALSLEEETNEKVLKKRSELSDILGHLKITINQNNINSIASCKMMIEEELKKCRFNTAEKISEFLNDQFPIKSYVEDLVEPVICFKVSSEINDEEAIIIGNAVELLLNSIEPENSEKYFINFVYDVCSWPVVVNKTFDENMKRA